VAGKFENGGADGPGAGLTPPRLAEKLMAIATSAPDRAALIGDLSEEFGRLHRRSPQSAKAWYWRQTARSAPHLFLKRLRDAPFQKIGIAIAATLGAFLLISLWEVWIARNAAREFAALTQASNFTAARIVYLAVQMLGVALGGAMIAIATFDRRASFMKNLVTRLAPAAFVLFAPALIASFVLADTYPINFRLLWTALSVPSLAIGAAAGIRLRR